MCEGLHRNARAVCQSRVKEPGLVSLVRPVNVLPFLVQDVNKDAFYHSPA